MTFLPFGHAGKSGSSMIYLFRTANGISHTKCSYISEIPSLFSALGEESEEEIKLVFIDDFIGTGSQAIETWDRIREIAIPRQSHMFLLTLVGFDRAIEEVTEKTNLQVITPRILSEEDQIFSPENTVFNATEKDSLRTYCERVGQAPTGFLNCQAMVIFHYRAPDNVISILRGQTREWKPLFPRRVM